jgi:hypothetical protein
MKTAVCFIHDRENWYLKYAINQAVSANHGAATFLVGSPSVRIDGCAVVDIEKYKDAQSAKDFLRLYKHMSRMSYEFESFCFLRWFYLLEFMKEYSIDFALYLDSDSLLYSSLEEVMDWAGERNKCGFLIPAQEFDSNYWVGSGNAAFWTKEMLQRFCDFMLRSYTEEKYLELYFRKWKSSAGGGICDMTALYLFWLENVDEICNMAVPKDRILFDLNMNSAANYRDNEFRKRFGMKQLQNYRRKPVFLLQANPGKVGVHAAHFQGLAKSFMPKYYSGPYFRGKAKLDFIAFFACALEILLRAIEKMTIRARRILQRHLAS